MQSCKYSKQVKTKVDTESEMDCADDADDEICDFGVETAGEFHCLTLKLHEKLFTQPFHARKLILPGLFLFENNLSVHNERSLTRMQ